MRMKSIMEGNKQWTGDAYKCHAIYDTSKGMVDLIWHNAMIRCSGKCHWHYYAVSRSTSHDKLEYTAQGCKRAMRRWCGIRVVTKCSCWNDLVEIFYRNLVVVYTLEWDTSFLCYVISIQAYIFRKKKMLHLFIIL